MNKEQVNPELDDNILDESDNMSKEQTVSDENINEADNLADKEGAEISEPDLITQVNNLKDSYLRLSAEFDNYRKRTLKEKSDLLKMASEKVILDIIPVIDDFERALENMAKAQDSQAMLAGIQLIHSKFMNILAKHSVKEVEVMGQLFDVDKHEAVTTIPAADESDKDKIVDCIQKGYSLGEKIIRFPKVIIAK